MVSYVYTLACISFSAMTLHDACDACVNALINAHYLSFICAAIAKLSSFVPANYFAQLVKDSGRVVFTGMLHL